MNFPIWELELGGGLLIAAVAITHVFIAHFAVGGGLFLVVTEHRAYRRADDALLAWLKRHSQFFALLTLVSGALTGVGIWFSIGLVHPAGTSALIHLFVWVWAIEWVFFVVEIVAAIIYAKTWDRLDRRTHLKVGWVYFVAAWLSLAAINGILSFMLTPGEWLTTQSLADAFWNPTYLSSLVVRTLGACAFAGIYVFITAWREDEQVRARLARWAAVWALPATVVGPAAAYLYFRTGGDAVWEVVQGGVPKAVGGFHVVMGSAVAYTLLLVVVVLLARKRPGLVSLPVGIVLLVWTYGSIGGAEFIRENARKPWIIGNVEHGGYMLVHGLRPDQVAVTQTAGLLPEARYKLPPAPGEGAQTNQGRNLFRLACRACHTLSGYNAIRPLVDGKSLAIITGILRTLDVRRGRMPAFPGNEEEQTLLAHYLAGLDGEVEPQASGSMPDRGQRLLDEYCLTCHSIDADDDDPPALLPRMRGWSARIAFQKLGMLDELNDEMPAFEGTPQERKILAETLAELVSGGAPR